MVKYRSIASSVSSNNLPTNICHTFAENDLDNAYVLLSSKDNRSIYKSGLYLLPKNILREIGLLGPSCLGNLYLEIVHTLTTKEVEGHDHILTFEELEQLQGRKLSEAYYQLKLKINDCFCRILTPLKPLTLKQMNEAGYPIGFRGMLMGFEASQGNVRLLDNICTVTKVQITLDNILVSQDSEFVQNHLKKENAVFSEYPFLDPAHPAYSSMLDLALKAKKALDIDKVGNKAHGYHDRVKAWTKDNKHDISANMNKYIASVTISDD